MSSLITLIWCPFLLQNDLGLFEREGKGREAEVLDCVMGGPIEGGTAWYGGLVVIVEVLGTPTALFTKVDRPLPSSRESYPWVKGG